MPSLYSHPRLVSSAKAQARKANRMEGLALLVVLLLTAFVFSSCTAKAYSLGTKDAQHPHPVARK